MSPHGRKYGEKESRPIPIWNGIFDHHPKIGPALWEFLWCIDRVTDESDPSGVGLVLGGCPVKIERILADIPGATERTVRRHLRRLERNGFIRRTRTPYGSKIGVLKSRKFGIWSSTQTGQNGHSVDDRTTQSGRTGRTDLPKRVAQVGRNKEDKAVETAEDAAMSAAPPIEDITAWNALGSDLSMGVPRFQKIYEHYFSTRNGNPLSDAMERAIQRANKTGVRVPKPFFDAKRVVERREAKEVESSLSESKGLKELEELPWHQH